MTFFTFKGLGVTADLVQSFKSSGKTQLSVMEVDGPDICKHGVVVPNVKAGGVAGLVEKPKVENAPSNLVSIGGYILTPDIFNILCDQTSGGDDEIQLSDAINS